MDILKRLVRTPVSTILWLFVLAAATLLLTIGSNLFYSVERLPGYMEQNFTTIGVVREQNNMPVITGEELDALAAMDEVLFLDRRGLVGAYSPQLEPVLSVRTDREYSYTLDYPYDLVMLTGTVSNVVTEEEKYEMDTRTTDGEIHSIEKFETKATLTVEQVLAAHGDYEIPKEISLLWGDFSSSGKYLREGERYIFYGWYAAWNKSYDPFDGYREDVLSGIQFNRSFLTNAVTLMDDGSFQYQSREGLDLPLPDIAPLDRSPEEFLSAPENQLWRDALQDLETTFHSLPMLGTQRLESVYGFNQGSMYISEGRAFTQEEYRSGARVCVISEAVARQSGLSVGDVISISQYEPQQAYNDMVNFWRERPSWDDGSGLLYRSVTPADTEGAAVSEGGAVTVKQRNVLNNPFIQPYFGGQGFATQNVEFTIVGLYRQENWWDESNSYAMTPNVMFAPQAALADCAYRKDLGGVYLSVVLQNGTMGDFVEKLNGTSLESRLLTFDQNFDSVNESVTRLRTASAVLMAVCTVCWLAVIALFVLLHQNREQQNLGIMLSVGVSRGQAARYLFLSGSVLLLAAVVIGVPCGRALTGHVVDVVAAASMEQAQATALSSAAAPDAEQIMRQVVESCMNPGELLFFAVLQAAAVAVILLVHALLLSRRRPRKLLEV